MCTECVNDGNARLMCVMSDKDASCRRGLWYDSVLTRMMLASIQYGDVDANENLPQPIMGIKYILTIRITIQLSYQYTNAKCIHY